MAWNWTEDEGEGSRAKSEYECLTCHRKVWAFTNGFLPIHRHKGKRNRCDGSRDPVRNHKKLNRK